VSFPVAAAHVVSVLITWPWADSKRQDHTRLCQEHSSEDSPIGPRQMQDWQLRRRTTGRTWNVPVCLKPSDGRRGQYPKPCTPSSYDDRRSFLLSFSRPRRRSRDDTEIGRSWCTAKWGVVAADGRIPVCECRIDGNRALQLRRISLRERGRIDAEAVFHGEGVRRGEAWHSGPVRRATERIPVLRGQCEKPT
jgi:hypothetical protein